MIFGIKKPRERKIYRRMLQNRIGKLVLLMVIVLGALLPMKVVYGDTLKDIPNRSSEEITYLLEENVLSGYPDGTFRPDKKVTREEAATLIGRALHLDGTKRETVFSDVSRYSYASGYIQSSYDQGAISGYPDGTYKPSVTMSRGQMAVVLTQSFGLSSGDNARYGDVDSGAYYYDDVQKVTSAGIAAGYPDGTYKPEASITREEFALFVARALNERFRVSSELDTIGERVVTADILNLRSGPSTGYRIVGKLEAGSVIKVYEEIGNWLKISYNNLTGYVHKDYTVKKQNGSRVIAIDAGHGGKDSGATGNGLVEKEVILDVSKQVRNLLEQSGIQVVMTRPDDTFISLNGRVDYAVEHNADTFVSIHANYFSDESANGIETYYSSSSLDERAASSKQLATFIQDRLVAALDLRDRGVKDVPFRVIDDTPLPSALVELGFISNDEDASKLGSSYWREKAAEGIYKGILDYYNWKE